MFESLMTYKSPVTNSNVSPSDPPSKELPSRGTTKSLSRAFIVNSQTVSLNSSLQAHNTQCGCQVGKSHTNSRKGTVAHCGGRRLVFRCCFAMECMVLKHGDKICQLNSPDVIWHSANIASPGKRNGHSYQCMQNLDKYLELVKETWLLRKRNSFRKK